VFFNGVALCPCSLPRRRSRLEGTVFSVDSSPHPLKTPFFLLFTQTGGLLYQQFRVESTFFCLSPPSLLFLRFFFWFFFWDFRFNLASPRLFSLSLEFFLFLTSMRYPCSSKGRFRESRALEKLSFSGCLFPPLAPPVFSRTSLKCSCIAGLFVQGWSRVTITD